MSPDVPNVLYFAAAMRGTLGTLQRLFSPGKIGSWTIDHVQQIIIAVGVFLAFYLLYRGLNSVTTRLMKRVDLDRTIAGFLLIILKYAVLLFGAMVALEQLNINVTSIVAGLGIIGVSIGFAAQNTLSNVIAGVFIFWDKPFLIGDLIEASDEYGEVKEITLRSTRIGTADGKVVSIPNSVLINNKIKCYTMEPHLRLDIDFTVPVTVDVEKVRRASLSTLEGDKRFLNSPAPSLAVTQLGAESVGLQLSVWAVDARSHIEVSNELRETINNLLHGPNGLS